ncbi:MAG: hypothetical protein CVU89_07960 [Firmicutes bacterium HGW-Firmicutes-14]|nr:MAG: hypothetical protein CVU89_07960 [Firmicutes bacterium HGW-Firmicutes-14]
MNRRLLFWAVLTRLLVFIVIYLTFYSYFPGRPPAPADYEFTQGPLDWSPLNPLLLYDGGQYTRIAEHGYVEELTVWFPFYPLLIRLLGLLTGNFGLAAAVIANISFFAALELLYRLARLDYGERVSFIAAVTIMVIPAGVFFNVAYSESLFLALILGSFYAARTERWWTAGILGGFAALTRNLGILVFPALLMEYYWLNKKSRGIFALKYGFRKKLPAMAGIYMVPFLFCLYPGYLASRFGDPLAFIHGQSGHFRAFRFPGWGIGADLVSMVQNPLDSFNFIILLNLLALILGVLALICIKRPSYRLYSLTYLFFITAMPLVKGNMPHSTGLFRFILGLFPLYLFLGRTISSRKGRYISAGISLFILLMMASLLARKIYIA